MLQQPIDARGDRVHLRRAAIAVATGVTIDGRRQVLGFTVDDAKDGRSGPRSSELERVLEDPLPWPRAGARLEFPSWGVERMHGLLIGSVVAGVVTAMCAALTPASAGPTAAGCGRGRQA